MKLLAQRKISAAILAVLIIMTVLLPVSIEAFGTECFFGGRVKLDGNDIPLNGSIVIGRIGELSWEGYCYFGNDSTRYALIIPANTDLVKKNGGSKGDQVWFSLIVDGKTYYYDQPVEWKARTQIGDYPLNFVTPPFENLIIQTSVLPEGVTGVQYRDTELVASGGIAPYTWSHNNLPTGLVLTNDGILYGKPVEQGLYPVEFTVKDNYSPQNEAKKTIELRIWLLGDADHDGVVSQEDITKAMMIFFGMEPYTASADVDQNGVVDIFDVILIRNMIP